MLEDILKLKSLVISWIVLLVLTAGFFFLFGPSETKIFGSPAVLPMPEPHSFAVIFFQAMQADLLPGGVVLVAMSPFSAMSTQVIVAFLLAFLLTFPWLLYQLVRYISPALYIRERVAFFMVLLPAMVLFVGGSWFAYKVMIPPTLRILYSYTEVMGSAAFFSVDSFIAFVAMFMFVTGIMFLLPVFMVLLSVLGIIPPVFWREHWRAAFVTVLIFSAVLTPDGSGVGMAFLSLPLGGLYMVGAGITSMRIGSRRTEEHKAAVLV